MARPPLALERIHENPNGSILLELKTPYANGTTALAFSGPEFIERLASIIPPPWKNLIRFWGCFAANSAVRSLIVPARDDGDGQDNLPTSTYIPWAELLRRVFKFDILQCKACGGRLKFVSAIFRRDVIVKILAHVGKATDPPEITPGKTAAPPYEPARYDTDDSNQELGW